MEIDPSVNPKPESGEQPPGSGVQSKRVHRRAPLSGASREKAIRAPKRGRPRPVWHIRVVRIESKRHPDWVRGQSNPFAIMDPAARIAEIDGFCARLWARTKRDAS